MSVFKAVTKQDHHVAQHIRISKHYRPPGCGPQWCVIIYNTMLIYFFSNAEDKFTGVSSRSRAEIATIWHFFTMVQQQPGGHGLLIVENSWSSSDIQQSVGLLWTSDQPEAETSPDNTQHSQQTDIHAPGGICNQNPSKRAAANPRFRPRGHWDRYGIILTGSYLEQYDELHRLSQQPLDTRWQHKRP
jgi:hypothetical protein